ncbi:MAG TPA: hypothetical protein ENJ53_04145 [Phaeodactylibacter sp.]|nr:hypothetical protein [Phaeodactylibacter sp.]
MKKYILLSLLFFSVFANAQTEKHTYRNGQQNLVMTPFRLPLPDADSVTYTDLDKDGDPDVLHATLPNGIKVQWIDDDDDMKVGDLEGDLDNDCVMLDLNKDGNFSGELDLMVDWSDEDGDGKADWQCIVDNAKKDYSGKWTSHYIWFWDADKDGVFGYVDWKNFKFEGWDHDGRANFYTDYNGKSMMLKVHITTSNLKDLEYNWENPFLYFDEDNDGLTEMAMRMVDEPLAIQDKNNPKLAWDFSHKISMVQMTFDLDNDNAPSNELDFDMSLKFKGKGFDYSDQIHDFKNLKGLEAANIYFEDPRWRATSRLIYPDHETAYNLTFERGDWQECWLVFDEDDDCQRWERVEFYDPKDPFKIGTKNGGLDHNPQADPSGDRGEWDLDFSGKGQIYISPMDCRIHLLGAEKGYWRIDQNATYFQGWQGWRGPNLQPEDFDKAEPTLFGTMKYKDTDNNGFMDEVAMDLDGDHKFESVFSLKKLGITDKAKIYNTAKMSYQDYQALYKMMANEMWDNAKDGVQIAQALGLNTAWYSTMMNPKSLREKYNYGYWLSFYLFQDMMKHATEKGDDDLKIKIQKAYFSSNWKTI